MSKWNFRLSEGLTIRQAINNNDNVMVITLLQKVTKKLSTDNRLEEDEQEEFRGLNELLEGEEQLVVSNEDVNSFGWENWEEMINSRLAEFYDLCDRYRIWIEV